jgi:hypothetical protein
VNRRVIIFVLVVACGRDSAQARQDVQIRRDSTLSGTVVKALATPTAPGRLIYDRPVDLSSDSLRVKRPDLVPAASRRR